MLGILLAAGRGTRMKSEKPKVLFDINDEPMAFGPLRALLEVCDKVMVVVGYRGAEVREALQLRASEVYAHDFLQNRLHFCTQDIPRGTGDAVRVAVESLGRSLSLFEHVLVVNGDLPLIRAKNLKALQKFVKEQELSSACFSYVTKNNKGLGRILRDPKGIFLGIREEKDASKEESEIKEVNGGVYCFKSQLLQERIHLLQADNQQKEFYLTDMLGLEKNKHARSEALCLRAPFDLWGVNTHSELSRARALAQYRLQKVLAEEWGVEFLSPQSTFVSARTKFHGEVTLGPSTSLLGRNVLDAGVRIEGCSQVKDSKILSGAQILWGTVIEGAVVGPQSVVGPMARLRPGTELGAKVKIGNFVELKKTKMESGSKASHLSYLGDAEVGEDSNIGCGTITCNYDGFNKLPTKIGKRAFIGSDTQLVAPVQIGDEAYIGSGTTVTQDVPSGALALSRAELTIKPGYAAKLAQRTRQKTEGKE